MNKVFTLLLALTALITISACGSTEDQDWLYDGYALVHGHYVGVVNIEVDEENVVSDIWLDEYYLPYNWARVSEDHAGADDVIEVTMRGNPVYFAKYIVIEDTLFTGEATDGYVAYTAEDIDDFYTWIDVEENADWYVRQVQEGNFFLANEDGSKSSYERVESSSLEAMRKSESDYWRFGDLGWDGNRDKTVDALIGLNLSDEPTIERNEDNIWEVNDSETGATWNDFKDYYDVILRAFNNGTD